MHSQKYILYTLIIFSLLFQYSCMNFKQPNPEIKYYTLEYDPPDFSGKVELPCIIKLESFRVSPLYDTTGIIYRENAYERTPYTYHRWSVNPGELVTYFTGRDLKHSGLFKEVLLPGERTRESSYRLAGMLDEFYELDNKKEWAGVLSLSISLIPEGDLKKSGQAIFQKTYKVTEKCKKKNPASLAEALSKAMEKISIEIGEDLYDFIKKGIEK